MGQKSCRASQRLRADGLFGCRNYDALSQEARRWQCRTKETLLKKNRSRVKKEMAKYVSSWGWVPILNIFSKLPTLKDKAWEFSNEDECSSVGAGILLYRSLLTIFIVIAVFNYPPTEYAHVLFWVMTGLSVVMYGCQLFQHRERWQKNMKAVLTELNLQPAADATLATGDEPTAQYVRTEIAGLRESLTGPDSRLGGLKREIDERISFCRSKLVLQTAAPNELQEKMVELLEQTLEQLEQSRQDVESRLAEISAFLDGYESRIIGHVSDVQTLQAIRDLNAASDDLAEQVRQAFRETVIALRDSITVLNDKVLLVSHQTAGQSLGLADAGVDFNQALGLMEAAAKETVDVETHTVQRLAVLAE